MWEKTYYKDGLAICEARILTDTIFFKFRKETYEFPSSVAAEIVMTTQGHFYYSMNHARIDEVRALAKKQKEREAKHG
jgi:hypothetical protein